MAIEQLRQVINTANQNLELEKSRKLKAVGQWAFHQIARTGVIDKFGEQVLERLRRLNRVNWSTPEARSTFIAYTREGLIPMMYAGHFVHLEAALATDGFAEMRNVAAEIGLEENLQRAIVTVAASVPNGKQDAFMAKMYPYLERYAQKNNATLVEVVRRKDVDTFGMVPKVHVLRTSLKPKGTAAVVFPYGGIQAGRHKVGGGKDEINGLLELYDPRDGTPIEDLYDMYKMMTIAQKREPYFQPFGISKAYELQDPDSYRPTPEGVISLYDLASSILRPFGFRRAIVTTRLGKGITGEDMAKKVGTDWKENIVDSNTYLMEEAAKLVEPNERGHYAYVGKQLSLAG